MRDELRKIRDELRKIREDVFRENREMELRAILEQKWREVAEGQSEDSFEGEIRLKEMKAAEWAKLSEILDEDIRAFRAQQHNPDEKMEKELFPPLQYSHSEKGENRHDEVDVVNWSQRASFSGINPTYRPCKHLLPRDFSKYTQEIPLSTEIAVKIRCRLARKSLGMDASEPWRCAMISTPRGVIRVA